MVGLENKNLFSVLGRENVLRRPFAEGFGESTEVLTRLNQRRLERAAGLECYSTFNAVGRKYDWIVSAYKLLLQLFRAVLNVQRNE